MLFNKKMSHHDHGSCGCGCGCESHGNEKQNESKNEHKHSYVNGVCECGKKESPNVIIESKASNSCGCGCGCGENHGHSHDSDEKDDGEDESEGQSSAGNKGLVGLFSMGIESEEDSCGCGEDHSHHHHEHDSCGCGEDHVHDHGIIVREEACTVGTDRIEFLIEGLHCAGCGAKIEKSVTALAEIQKAEMNFAISTLNVYPKGIVTGELEKRIIKIVEDTEPGTKATLKGEDEGEILEFELKGLNCAACAGKIERKVKQLPGALNVSFNFAISKLEVNVNEVDALDFHKDIEKIVKSYEPHVEVLMLTEVQGEKIEEDKKQKGNKGILARIAVSLGLIGVGIFVRGQSFEIIPFIIAYLLVGFDIIKRSFMNIKKGEVFDENFLMTIASCAALYVGEYPEAVLVMLLYQVGEYFQGRAVESSRKSIANLMDIRPDYANLKIGNDTKKVSPNNVKIGDVIVVKAGEKVPLDGVIIEGSSSIDTKALTGESAPQDVGVGDSITSGFINIDGLLIVEVKKRFKDSAVSRILNLVQNASAKKAKTELRITKFARYYTPVVVMIAALSTIIPPLFFGGDFNEWLLKSATFLVVSCPCALVISVPMTYFAGLGASSKNGILVKGGNYLEALSRAEIVVFDKTGTLTKGNFKVEEVFNTNGYEKEEVLRLTAHLESFSNHPIAVSIVEEYHEEIDKSLVSSYKEIKGKGVKALIGDKKVVSGNVKFMRDNGINVQEAEVAGTIVYTAINDQYAGYIAISDEVKPDSKEAVEGFQDVNVNKVVMLTGDRKITADKVAKELGINDYRYELLPDQKVDEVEKLMETKGDKALVFVGDGINDAPVLARADVGVAMGGVGSDAAIEAADVVIMNDEPSKLIKGIKISKKTKKIVDQNIVFSLGIKLGIMVAVGVTGAVPMWVAVLGDVGVAVLAVFNAMRVLRD